MADSLAGTATRALVDPAAFRSLMTAHLVGVTIVTTVGPDDEPWGMTCSSLCGVSLQPPTLLVCLRAESPTLAALLKVSAFAVNLLHDQAEPVAQLFSSGAPDRFEKARWVRDPVSGVPHLVEDAHTIADCEVSETLPVGDHVVVFGQVLQVATHANRPVHPLMYGMRRYWSLPIPTDDGSGR